MKLFAKKTAIANTNPSALEGNGAKSWKNASNLRVFKAIAEFISTKLKQTMRSITATYTAARRKASTFWLQAKDIFAKEVVTVNIEASSLRFLVTKGNRATRWGSIPLEPGTIKDGLVLNNQALSNAINELISSKRLKKGTVVTSLSGFQSVHRIVELPRMPAKLLNEAILIEAKRTMPVSQEQLYLSWQAMRGGKDSYRFFLLGAPKNLLDSEFQVMKQSGLKPNAMNLKPIALARMVNRSEALIIDMEPESCEIIVVAGGIPAIIRNIPMHSENDPLTRAQHILQEFERTLQFYETNYPDLSLSQDTPLFFSGELANDKYLSKAISAGVGFKVESLQPALKYPPDLPLGQYAVNIGLAASGPSAKNKGQTAKFLISDIDILPSIYRPRHISTRQAASAFGIIMGIALILPLYKIGDSSASDVHRLQNQYNALQQSFVSRQALIKQANQIQKNISGTESKIQNLQTILDNFQNFSQQRQRAYNSLYPAVSHTPDGILPDGVKLTSISQSNNKLSLLGTAPDCESALAYADALRRAAGFTNVRVNSLTETGDKEKIVKFDISLDWK